MDNRQPKKWHYILFLVIAISMFIVSVLVLSAKNIVSDKFPHTDSYKHIFDHKISVPGTTQQNIAERATPSSEPEGFTKDMTEHISDIHTEEITTKQPVVTYPSETQPQATEPPATTSPTEPATTPFVPPVVTETDLPFVRTEPAISGKIDEYAVAESTRADDSFFADALFIGDSRTQGIQYDGNFSNATFYAYKGLNVITAMKSPFVNEFGEEMMLVDAIGLHPEFKKIYICFGLNDYWFKESAYREKYAILIDAIKAAASPDAQIYMYSVIPVWDGMQKSDEGLNNANIIRFNKIAAEIAREKGVRFIDASEAFIKEDGYRYLTEDESPDGIHLNKPEILKLCEYLRTHI